MDKKKTSPKEGRVARKVPVEGIMRNDPWTGPSDVRNFENRGSGRQLATKIRYQMRRPLSRPDSFQNNFFGVLARTNRRRTPTGLSNYDERIARSETCFFSRRSKSRDSRWFPMHYFKRRRYLYLSDGISDLKHQRLRSRAESRRDTRRTPSYLNVRCP